MNRRVVRPVALLVGMMIVLGAMAAPAQVPLLPDEFERVDVIAIERDGRDYFAFDALTGQRSTIRLEIGEEVLFERSRGQVALVLTDRRVLGVASGLPWLEERLGLEEQPTARGLVQNRIGLVVTNRRALAFTATSGWVDESLGLKEEVLALRAGAAAAVVTTNRRALGAAPALQGFIAADLDLQETLESVTAQDTLITLRTDRRILVFSAPRGSWSEQKRRIR